MAFEGRAPNIKKTKSDVAIIFLSQNFEKDVERWIDKGIFVPWKEKVREEREGVLPPMAVVQPTKNKVRSALDFRELNVHVT